MFLINKIFKKAFFRFVLIGSVFATVLSACSEGDPRTLYESLIVEFNDVQSISVSALNTVITTGDSLQLTVTGTTSTLTTVDLTEEVSWSLSDTLLAETSIATLTSTGLLESLSTNGTVRVTVTLASYTDTIDIEFSSAALASIEVKADTLTPDTLSISICRPLPLKAMGTYDDSTVRNITASVIWSTTTAGATLDTDSTPPSISNYQVVATDVKATLGLDSPAAAITIIDDITSMALSPAVVTLTIGSEQTFVLSAGYGSETVDNITAAADWDSTNSSVASFAHNDGIMSALSLGSTTISAACGSAILPATSSVTVDANNISTFEIGPDPTGFTLPLGSTQQMKATAYYSSDPQTPVDVTDQVSWTVKSGSVAISVDSFGLVSADADGFGTVVANFSGETAEVPVYVVP